jgi:ribosomal peptide maturation radical SAM protein 1
MKILLLNMPFYRLDHTALGISLLKAGLERAGFPCDILYLNLAFAERVCRAQEDVAAKLDAYIAYWEMGMHPILLGDWTFAGDLFGEPGEAGGHVEEVVASTFKNVLSPWAPPQVDRQAMSSRALQMRAHVTPFLADCMERIAWEAYDIVGFTCTYHQQTASLALARRIKERYSKKMILFGGPGCEQEMGEALHRLFPFVDVVCSGKVDGLLPKLVRRLRCGEDLGSLPKIAFRRDGESCFTMRRLPLAGALDDLPYPDYSDYFAQLEYNLLSGLIRPILLIETSGGCWWGKRSHCTFCGYNGVSLAYTRSGEALLVRDARGPAVTWVRLRGPQCAVYEFCGEAHALPAIEAQARRACAVWGAACDELDGSGAVRPADGPAGTIELEGLREMEYSRPGLERLLAALVDLRLMVQEDGHYLSLAIHARDESGPVALKRRL